MSQYRIVESVITSIFEKILKNDKSKSSEDALYFRVCIKADNYGYEKDGNTYHEEWEKHTFAYCHVIMQYPHSVYMAITDSFDIPDLKEFDNLSNHNSCWRSALSFASVQFAVWDSAFSHVPREHQPPSRDEGIYYDMTPLLRDIFKEVKIKTKYLEDDYHKEIIELKEIKNEKA